jgi:antitoxin (DNA-binding transcriptional repressor) of toxin-antitoxin stability system
MTLANAVSPRDLRANGRAILDAVESGRSFAVTRDGQQIGELVPIKRKRTFVSRHEFAAMSANAPAIDLARFRAEQEIVTSGYLE